MTGKSLANVLTPLFPVPLLTDKLATALISRAIFSRQISYLITMVAIARILSSVRRLAAAVSLRKY
jgi:hypothetical protein